MDISSRVSVISMRTARDLSASGASGTAWAVYALLRSLSNNRQGAWWASIGEMASCLCVSHRTAQRAVAWLEAAGFISRVRRSRIEGGSVASGLRTGWDLAWSYTAHERRIEGDVGACGAGGDIEGDVGPAQASAQGIEAGQDADTGLTGAGGDIDAPQPRRAAPRPAPRPAPASHARTARPRQAVDNRRRAVRRGAQGVSNMAPRGAAPMTPPLRNEEETIKTPIIPASGDSGEEDLVISSTPRERTPEEMWALMELAASQGCSAWADSSDDAPTDASPAPVAVEAIPSEPQSAEQNTASEEYSTDTEMAEVLMGAVLAAVESDPDGGWLYRCQEPDPALMETALGTLTTQRRLRRYHGSLRRRSIRACLQTVWRLCAHTEAAQTPPRRTA